MILHVIIHLGQMISFPNLSRRQIEKLSDISSDLGLVAAASVIIPAVLEKFNVVQLLFGAIASVAFWFISLLLRR